MCCTKIIAVIILSVTGVVFIGLGAGLGWGLFPSLVENGIAEEVALVNGSDAWGVWEKTPIPLTFKVYFFNVTNAEEVMSEGAKPILKEMGPYVYDLWKSKYDIELEEDETMVSYHQDQNFTFNPILSGNLKEDDKVTMLHVTMMGSILDGDIAYDLGRLSDSTLDIINGAIDSVYEQGDTVFNTYTVKQWLFEGVPLKCTNDGTPLGAYWQLYCDSLKDISDPLGTIRPEVDEDGNQTGNYLYAYFYPTNNTHDGLYTINTGIKDPKMLGWIHKWEGNETLQFWSGPECNVIRGTDAAIFPPFLTRESRVDIFSTDLCRSLYAVYDQDIEYKDIPGYRYIADDKQLATAADNPENYCWCADNAGCLKEGSLDLYPCQDAALILTFPHFYQSSQDYLDLVDGLSPDRAKHETLLDIEPLTGVPLRGAKRIQFNMMIKPVHNVNVTQNLPQALMPLLWIDEGVELDDANSELLRTSVYGVITALQAVRWVMISLGIVGIGTAIVVFFFFC